MTASLSVAKKSDKWIPWYFVAFFVVIAILDGVFITLAIRTQTGVVTERAYEKGLAYNNVLDEAARQAELGIVQKAEFRDGKLAWRLEDKNGQPLNAKVIAHFFRPTHDSHDFDMQLKQTDSRLYEARPYFRLPGAWTVRLEAAWQDSHSQTQRYSTKFDLIAP